MVLKHEIKYGTPNDGCTVNMHVVQGLIEEFSREGSGGKGKKRVRGGGGGGGGGGGRVKRARSEETEGVGRVEFVEVKCTIEGVMFVVDGELDLGHVDIRSGGGGGGGDDDSNGEVMLFTGQGDYIMSLQSSVLCHARVLEEHGLVTFIDNTLTATSNNCLCVCTTLVALFPAFHQPTLVSSTRFNLLSHLYPHHHHHNEDPLDTHSFYATLKPAPPVVAATTTLQPKHLIPTLLPFQQRSVHWLLNREGKKLVDKGKKIVDMTRDEIRWGLFDWIQFQDAHGIWLNRMNGEISSQLEGPKEDWCSYHFGALLAEEPGLGKTLEITALIMLNPANPITHNPSLSRWDPVSQLHVKPVRTTLIITPLSLSFQWQAELKKHAPSLKVLFYEGWQKFLKSTPTTTTTTTKTKSKSKQDPVKNSTNPEQDHLINFINTHDIIITTYPILRTDLHVARVPPVRPRRRDVVYSNADPGGMGRKRSLLVSVGWWRVVMDEVQEGGGRGIEEMVSLIPRHSSMAVSGTPVGRANVGSTIADDLIHILRFLRVTPPSTYSSSSNSKKFKVLDEGLLRRVFERVAVRTTKKTISNELTTPLIQTRYLVPVVLGGVERAVYQNLLSTSFIELGVDSRGISIHTHPNVNVGVDGVVMRSVIRRLRGVCTHPQVGQLTKNHNKNKKDDGGNKNKKNKKLKSMGEVLIQMQETNWKSMLDDQRGYIISLIKQSQITHHLPSQHHTNNNNMNKYRAVELVLVDARGRLGVMRGDLLVLGRGGGSDSNSHSHSHDSSDDDDDEEGDGENGEKRQRQRQKNHQGQGQGPLKTRLREIAILEHQILFLLGDVYHSIGGLRYKEMEDEAYEGAEKVRRVLLAGTESEAQASMDILLARDRERNPTNYNNNNKKNGKSNNVVGEEMMTKLPLLDIPDEPQVSSSEEDESEDSEEDEEEEDDEDSVPRKIKEKKWGSKTGEIVHKAHTFISTILNPQSSLLSLWRNRIVELLTRAISNDGDGDDGEGMNEGEGEGEYYQRSLDDQIEVEIYMQQYTALLADRKAALVNERTLLAIHDHREKKARLTKAAIRANNNNDGVDDFDFDDDDDDDDEFMFIDNDGIRPDEQIPPQHLIIQAELKQSRIELVELGMMMDEGRSLKSIAVQLHNTLPKIPNRSHKVEKKMAKENLECLNGYINEQVKYLESLEADLSLFRKAFNQRILYFRQLQEISDSVAPITLPDPSGPSIVDLIGTCKAEQAVLDQAIKSSRARQRYLDHLADGSKEKGKEKDGDGDGDEDEEEDICILCRCEFVKGFITQCAHVFCEPCLYAWLARKDSGKTCPVCRVAVDIDTMEPFLMGQDPNHEQSQTPAPKKELGLGDSTVHVVPKSKRRIEYNTMDPQTLEDIQKQVSYGDFGSKVQSVIRHLLYLEDKEPGCKSIIFSAWADSLSIMEEALTTNGIMSLRIDQKKGKKNVVERFREEEDISVLLLHGERENSGLNITCASRVFLLESVVHHGFEIQAIARIDRMGQTKPTEVFCYYAEDTIEKNILDLAARKGLSLYTKDNSAGTVNIGFADDEEKDKHIDAPGKTKTAKKVQKGDFVMKIEDMQAILWPHMVEDIEYLLDEDDTDVVMHDGTTSGDNSRTVTRESSGAHSNRLNVTNAVAGPSRLR